MVQTIRILRNDDPVQIIIYALFLYYYFFYFGKHFFQEYLFFYMLTIFFHGRIIVNTTFISQLIFITIG